MTNKNTKQPKATPETTMQKNVFDLKVDAMWKFAADYLEVLKHFSVKYDKGFAMRYNRLMDYVHKKIALPENCEIIAEYAMFQVRSHEDTPELPSE